MAIATATALLAAAATTAAATAYGANKSSSAIKTATKAATKASDTNNALARDIYGENKSVLSPYIDSGVANAGKLNALLDTNPYSYKPGNYQAGSFEEDPGYQFRKREGLSAVTQNRTTAGLLRSGSALKALNDYAQGSASQEYNNWFNRDQTRINGEFNRDQANQAGQNNVTSQYINALGNQQGVGLAAGSALAGVGNNYVNATSANNNNAANVQGNAAIAGANQTNALIGQGINAAAYVGGNGGFNPATRGSSYPPINTSLYNVNNDPVFR